ncbi:trypco2 family protein [Streptomyces sp. NPDC058991]|uniref:trypco2 family protein n=1 Tax=unclassified Streptomyces TaxID=2593676 RepID=UPI0036C339AB
MPLALLNTREWWEVSRVDDKALGLASALEALREELESALQSSQGHAVRFRATDVTLTVETVARLDKEGSGKIRWYLVDAGAGAKSTNERTQTLTLNLTPVIYDSQGRPIPLDVSGQQRAPGP